MKAQDWYLQPVTCGCFSEVLYYESGGDEDDDTDLPLTMVISLLSMSKHIKDRQKKKRPVKYEDFLAAKPLRTPEIDVKKKKNPERIPMIHYIMLCLWAYTHMLLYCS